MAKTYKELVSELRAENAELKRYLKCICEITEDDAADYCCSNIYAFMFGRAQGFAKIALERYEE